MTTQFKVRRDYSTNNVPVVGYQDTADAQDVILWAARQVTVSNVTTDSTGTATVTTLPILDMTHDHVTDGGGVARQRLINGEDVTVSGGLYVGTVDGALGTVKIYTDADLTTSAINRTGLTLTYYTLTPITVDANGKISATVSGSVSITGTPNVAVTSIPDVGIVGTVPVSVASTLSVTPTNTPVSNVFKKLDTNNASGIAGASALVGTCWTPAAGKKFKLKQIQIFNNHATVDFRGWLKDGGTGITCDFYVPAKQSVTMDFGQGLLSTAANNTITIYGYTCSAYTISTMCQGTEE